jgi:hypothetical protein
MAGVFKTAAGSLEAVEIAGVGAMHPDGKGGVSVEKAALTMSELQEKDDNGVLKVTDDGDPIPLTGTALTNAAKKLAEERGWQVVQMKEENIATLPQEVGYTADRPPASEVAEAAYQDMYAGLQVVNNDPEQLVKGGDQAGTVLVPGEVVDTPKSEGDN